MPNHPRALKTFGRCGNNSPEGGGRRVVQSQIVGQTPAYRFRITATQSCDGDDEREY